MTRQKPRPLIAVARWSLRAGRPLLAICRGMQVVNVAMGGTLVQAMPTGQTS